VYCDFVISIHPPSQLKLEKSTLSCTVPHMSLLCASWSWAAPVTVAGAGACPSTRPARVTLRALPRGRSAPSPAPLLRIQLGRRPRGAFSLSRCQKGTDRHLQPEPEPEPELGREDGGPDAVSAQFCLDFLRNHARKIPPYLFAVLMLAR
jgi:hypothetical protein